MSSKVFGTSEDGAIEFLLYSEKYQDGALNVMLGFFENEAFCVGAEINTCPDAIVDMNLFALEMLKKSCTTIIARDVNTDEVVGVAVNTIISKPNSPDEPSVFDEIRESILKTDNSKSAISALIEIESKFDFFEHFKVDSIMELLFLSTLPEYGGKRIGYTLTKYTIQLMQEFKNGNSLEILPTEIRESPPKILTATMTSKYSQKIARGLGFSEFVTMANSNFIFRGKSFAERMGEPESVTVLVAKEI